jgi:hypothetical protein
LIDTENKTEALLASVINQEQKNFAQLAAIDLWGTKFQQEYHEQVGQYLQEMPSIEEKDEQSLRLRRKFVNNASFLFSVLCKPTYQPVKYINQKIYLFNHHEGLLLAFDEDGNQLSEQPITYQKDKQWAKEIIVNEEHTRCFAKYMKDGVVTLHEIDLNTGQVKSSLTLGEHTFPEQIRIKGDFVYYTCKESLYSDGNKRYLWKRPLPE